MTAPPDAFSTHLTLRGSKHHGLGNDFVVVDAPVSADSDMDIDLAALAVHVCDRRRGIGADGLLVNHPPSDPTHDARMTLHNADGSRAEMSGNGIRCFAQALWWHERDRFSWIIDTDAGVREVTLRPTDDPLTCQVRVDMGSIEPIAEPDGWTSIGAHPDRPVEHVSVGNPHTVVGVDEVAVVDLAGLGGMIPQVNLEIIEPGPEPHAVTMRVHERGAGITEACGTGACASAWAARRWGLVPSTAAEVLVHMDGGDAQVAIRADERAVLTGPATFVGHVEIAVPHELARPARRGDVA